MEQMQQKDLLNAVSQLVYYLRREQKNASTIEDALKRVKEKILKRNNAKHIEIYRLFRRYTDKQMIAACKESFDRGRYYRYKITTNLLTNVDKDA